MCIDKASLITEPHLGPYGREECAMAEETQHARIETTEYLAEMEP